LVKWPILIENYQYNEGSLKIMNENHPKYSLAISHEIIKVWEGTHGNWFKSNILSIIELLVIRVAKVHEQLSKTG